MFPTFQTFNEDGSLRFFEDPDDLFNYLDWTYLQTPLRRYSLGIMSNFLIGNQIEAYVEASFTRSKATVNLAPTTANFRAQVNTDNPLLTADTRQMFFDNFYNPDLDLFEFSMRKRFTELGARRVEHNRDYGRIVAGLRGQLWDQWEFDAWVTYTRAEERLDSFNAGSESRLLQGLRVDPVSNECYDPSNGCVPLNIFGVAALSAEGTNFMRVGLFDDRTERTQKLASVVITGPLFDNWAGSVDVAMGLEWRSDNGNFKANELLFTGDILGAGGGAPTRGTESVYEVYGEAIIPIAENVAWAEYLALEIGARYSEYDNAGGSSTYKIGMEWQPVEAVRFRAMHQRSVRAPTLEQLFEEQHTFDGAFYTFRADPCSVEEDPIGAGIQGKCIAQGLNPDQVGVFEAIRFYPTEYKGGGNPDLEPETSETLTVGFVLEFEHWGFAVDYFDVAIEDIVLSLDASTACFDMSNVEGRYCSHISRDSTGNVAAVSELNVNGGVKDTRGVDTQLQFSTGLPAMLSISDDQAQLTVKSIWTHTMTLSVQEYSFSSEYDCSGFFGSYPCFWISDNVSTTHPENRVNTNMSYHSGPWNMHLNWRWIEGTKNAAPLWDDLVGGGPFFPAISSISNQNYFDIGVSYDFGDRTTLRFGVSNLLDEEPPFMADQAFNNNTDTTLYDPFGRSYSLTVSTEMF